MRLIFRTEEWPPDQFLIIIDDQKLICCRKLNMFQWYKQLHSEFKKFEPHTKFEQNFNQIIKSSHFQRRRIFDMNESKHSWRFVGSLHTFSSRHNQYFMWSGHMTVAWLHIYELINIQLQRYKKIQTNYTSTAFLQDYKSLRFYKNIDISTT